MAFHYQFSVIMDSFTINRKANEIFLHEMAYDNLREQMSISSFLFYLIVHFYKFVYQIIHSPSPNPRGSSRDYNFHPLTGYDINSHMPRKSQIDAPGGLDGDERIGRENWCGPAPAKIKSVPSVGIH